MSTEPLQPASDRGDYILSIERIREAISQTHSAYQDNLPMWVAYGPHTSDHPGLHILRLHLTIPNDKMPAGPTNFAVRAASFEQIMELIPDELTALGRQPQDDPNILNVWL